MTVIETIKQMEKEFAGEYPVKLLSLSQKKFIPQDMWNDYLNTDIKYLFDDVDFNPEIIIYID